MRLPLLLPSLLVACADAPKYFDSAVAEADVEWGPVQRCAAPVDGLEGFVDRAAERGLDIEIEGDTTQGTCNYIPGGVVAQDMDADGDIDLLYNNEADFPHLFVNDGSGHFTREAVAVGPAPDGRKFYNTAAVDVDGDRLPDVFRVGDGFLVWSRNLGDLRFGDWELVYDEPAFPRGCYGGVVFGDLDADGDLDLVLPGLDQQQYEGHLITNDEASWIPAHDLLFENVGGTWELDRRLSPWGEQAGFSLVQAFTDRDNDGDLDLMSCTDRPLSGLHPPQAFWSNEGGGGGGLPTLVDVAPETNSAVNASAMGLGTHDLNQDGRLDYCMSDVAPALTCLMSDGGDGYYEGALALGLRPDVTTHPDLPADWETRQDPGPQTMWVSWGIAMLDLDNDGNLDAGVVAGPPPDAGSVALSNVHDWQPDWLWMGEDDGTFTPVDPATSPFHSLQLNYGLVSADLDGDGYRELIKGPFTGRPQLFDNPCGSGHWLEVDLVGPGDNAEAFGARVIVYRGAHRDVQELHNLIAVGQSPSELHFGLGDRDTVDRLVVRWVDGTTTELSDFAADRKLTIWHPDAR